MAVSNKPWDGSPSRWDTPEAYCSACLIDTNEGDGPKSKAKCSLPVHEPGGMVNANALRAAAGALAGARGGVQAPPAAKKAAARKLVSMMRGADMSPGDGLMRMAGM